MQSNKNDLYSYAWCDGPDLEQFRLIYYPIISFLFLFASIKRVALSNSPRRDLKLLLNKQVLISQLIHQLIIVTEVFIAQI